MKLIFFEQQEQFLIGSNGIQVLLISLQPHEQTTVRKGQRDGAVFLILDIKHAAVHDVLVIVRQRRFAGPQRRVIRMIRRTAVQMQGAGQDQGEAIVFLEGVNFRVNVQQQIAFKGGARGLQPIDAVEFEAVRIEGGNFENVFKEGDLGAGFHCCSVM